MRKTLRTLAIFAIVLFSSGLLQAQTGSYTATGFFFHPSASRSIGIIKSISQVGPSTYVADFGDLGGNGFQFQFQINASNQLVNWAPVGNTPVGSGFMTADNPGGINYANASPNAPGAGQYTSSIYNNTYNPATNTFYMHYGYEASLAAPNQTGYTRQVYEKWTGSVVSITSASPTNITEGTVVILKGRGLSTLSDIGFGNSAFVPAQSTTLISDSELHVVVGKGASRSMFYTAGGQQFIYGSFNYLPPVQPIAPWKFVGDRGFTSRVKAIINIAIGSDDVPYIIHAANNSKPVVSKFVNNAWVQVGDTASAGAMAFPNIAIDKANTPWVVFADSLNGGKLTVKKFNGSKWIVAGQSGFATIVTTAGGSSLCFDSSNVPYVTSYISDSATGLNRVCIYYLKNGNWVKLGGTDIGVILGIDYIAFAIDKRTNTPYVVVTDNNNNFKGTVRKFDGSHWVAAGAPGFTSGARGAYYPGIAIDGKGDIYTSFQNDNGPEQASVYKLVNGNWNSVGQQYFSPEHVYALSLAVSGSGIPYILFRDELQYQQGTVMRLNPNGDSTWQVMGNRGFAPAATFNPNALAINSKGVPYIAFADYISGNGASVMTIDSVPVPVLPSVTSFKPAAAATATTVNIKGLHFTGATKVSFGDSAAASFTVVSDTVINAKVGKGASGNVTVTTPAGTAAKAGFLYCAPFNPLVTIAANPGNNICAKTPVTITAAVVKGGDSVVYVWRKNGVKVGTGGNTYIDSALKNNDAVNVVITTYSNCATTALKDTSNTITFKVNPVITPTATIKSSAGTVICSGTQVTFTATKATGDDSVSFAWKKNGKKVGTNSATYTDNALKKGDTVWLVLTSHTPCATSVTVNSNLLIFTVNANLKKQVTIAASDDTVCTGVKVTFTATAVNAGTGITYSWSRGGVHVGKNTRTYTDTLNNGDKVTCTIVSSAACSLPDTAVSNGLTFVVLHKPGAPAAITGKAAVTANQAGLTYSTIKVTGVTYAWTVPSTATITAGQGTRTITVTWGSNTGNVTVKAVNDCGSSPVVTKDVTITPGLVATGAEENTSSSSSLKKELLYPNPATTNAHLTLSGYQGKLVITISDVAGKVLWKTEKQNSGTYDLPVNKFAAGIYLVTVKDAATVKTFKLLKAK